MIYIYATILTIVMIGVGLVCWIADTKKKVDILNDRLTISGAPEIIEYEASDGAELKKAYKGDACYDLHVLHDFALSRRRSVIPTGLKIALPDGYSATVRPRSGVTSKGVPGIKESEGTKSTCRIYGTSEIGTIDAGYRGEIKIIFRSDIDYSCTKSKYIIPAGTRLAQLYIHKDTNVIMDKVDKIRADNSDRQSNGFASSGYKDS